MHYYVMTSRLNPDALKLSIAALGFSKEDTLIIANNILSKKVLLLALSGKLASGKDSLALEAMNSLGFKDAIHVYFGDSIKGEVDQIISLILSNEFTQEQYINLVQEEQGVVSPYITEIVELLTIEKAKLTLNSARDRSPSMRRVLQLWGTEVRREQDALYWVNKTLKSALSWVCLGKSVYLTDARFPNEVAPAQSVGFIVARVEITPQTQASRLLSRDGIPVDYKAINHSSEVALDGYEGFDITIDNNGNFAQSLDDLTLAIGRLQ